MLDRSPPTLSCVRRSRRRSAQGLLGRCASFRPTPLRLCACCTLYLTIAAFAHSSSHDGGERASSRERVVVRSCAADLVVRTPISSAGTASPSWPTRLVPTDATTPPSPAATRRRRVCSLEPNKTTRASARQATSASFFGRWPHNCVPADTPVC